MIVYDQKLAHSIAAGVLMLGLSLSGTSGVSAAEPEAKQAASAPTPTDAPLSVSLVRDGQAATVATHAQTVGALLEERGLRPAPSDYLSPGAASPLSEGATIVLRSAVPIRLVVGREQRRLDSAATSVGELLAEAHVVLRPSDEVSPAATAPLAAGAVVHVVRVDSWTAHSHARILPGVKARVDAKLLRGKTRTIDPGAPGVREVTLRFVKRGDAAPTRIVLASRIVHAPRARVIVRGIATYESLARVAQLGFASALHFASSALQMLATAYTAGCSGCSGITASGARAGFGIIAVDPSVIPLGTHIFIPGYGAAVAGDTGGAILGRRIDLGFNSDGEAMRWGRRPVTVYILK